MSKDTTKKYIEDTVQNLTKAATTHEKLESDLTLPSVFQQAGPWITLAQNIIQKAQTELEKMGEKPVGKDLYQFSRSCKAKSNLLNIVFKSVEDGEEKVRSKLYTGAVAREKERAVEVILGGILEEISKVVGSGSLEADQHQKDELKDALEEILALATKNTKGEQALNFSGVGDMFNNLSGGEQNVGKDHATLYIADTMHTAEKSEE